MLKIYSLLSSFPNEIFQKFFQDLAFVTFHNYKVFFEDKIQSSLASCYLFCHGKL